MKIHFKKLIFVLTALLLIPACAFFGTFSANNVNVASKVTPSRESTALRVMSFNLLADYKGFGGGEVLPRAELFSKLVSSTLPDVICLQEESFNWFCQIEKSLKDYRQIRPLTCFLGLKMTSVLYKKSTLTLLESGETEYEACDDFRTRRAVYGIFRKKDTGEHFIVISTHLGFLKSEYDLTGLTNARSQCSRLIALSNELSKKHGCPVIICGDFNSKENTSTAYSEIYNILKSVYSDARYTSQKLYCEERLKEAPSNDHIFTSGNVCVLAFSVVSDEEYSEISDHLPIFADILLKER